MRTCHGWVRRLIAALRLLRSRRLGVVGILLLHVRECLTRWLGIEKPMRIEHHQPRLVPPPVPEPQERPSTRSREWVERSKSVASRAASRGSFSVRRKLNAYNGIQPRRPRMQIGAPSDFRHVDHALPRRAETFRPLELSIYMPENQLSPMMPHFGDINDLSFPLDDLKDLPRPTTALTHSRSESALSFRIPRKPIRSSSRASSEWTANFKPRPGSLSAQELLEALEKELPMAPPPARLRAMTEPPSYERVKSALHEKFELEQRLKDIDEQIEERKSIYLSSRPTSRATSRPLSVYEECEGMSNLSQFAIHWNLTNTEPMPTPPIAPSFAARVASPSPLGAHPYNQRPKTAPSKTVHIPARLKSFTEASATFTTPSPSSASTERGVPPPPLPLVLKAPPHPPLRKKKSFSRVSNWLFPADHSRNTSLESVTNMPKPVTSREGFYQCVELDQTARPSISSVGTVSTLESELSELDRPPVAPTWTPDSSPSRHTAEKIEDVAIRTFSMDSERNEKSIELQRMRTFGEKEMGVEERWRMQVDSLPVVPGRNSVGVAF
jgi:hypothetical protein